MLFYYLFAILLVVLTLFLKYLFSYWDRHGLPNVKPDYLFGNLKTVIMQRESFGIAVNQLYWRMEGQLVGIYLLVQPAILIRDAHLAHRIMTADFNCFQDRGVYCNEERYPFTASLFTLPGKQWSNLRHKLTPLFSGKQLRAMMPTILDVGIKLQRHLEPIAEFGQVLEIRDVISRFVLEIIATVFFGCEANCIADRDDAFSRIMRQAQALGGGITACIRAITLFIGPGFLKYTRMSILDLEVEEFATKIVTQQIEIREKTDVSRNDFIQQLINLRRDASQEKMTILQCASNVFLFYIAGSETSTAAISFTMHELTQNPGTMSKLQAEIDEMLKRTNGIITYDALKEMRFLDLCVKETLRKYPSLPILNRECTKDYKVPESEVVIRKGTKVVIPLMAYSMDEKYFPEPDRYYPERFDPATQAYDEKAYYPFGVGPRNCIAYRMGALVAKIGLILILSKFGFKATQGPKIQFTSAAVTLIPKDGIHLAISSRNR